MGKLRSMKHLRKIKKKYRTHHPLPQIYGLSTGSINTLTDFLRNFLNFGGRGDEPKHFISGEKYVRK